MAQTGYTPLLIYSSSTGGNTPAVGNLTNSTLGSELAINITDGKLFYKDNANAIQVIGWKTVPTSAGGTGLTSYAAGDLIYYASGTTFTKLGIGSAYQALQVNAGATAPSWQPSASSVLTAQGDLLYASAANTLARLAKNTTASRYLSNSGSNNNPAWAQIDLTNGVTGTLPVGNGGTGNTTGAATAVKSNATTGLMEIVGPAASTTRVMTIPNANFTAARTDAAQTFNGDNTFSGSTYFNQTSAALVTRLAGNDNAQGTAQIITVVRQYSVVSLGTKLIIPFFNQGSLNSNTTCKVWGHGARFNTTTPLAFEITFAVGHSTSLANLASWGGNGNYSSIAINGMNIEITFTTAYTSSTGSGVFASIAYMTNRDDFSIDVANIAMN